MTFIEKTFPVNFLNKVALAEGNSKKPVYKIHKWWARRLGSVFRMIILSIFSSRSENEIDICKKFCEGTSFKNKIILDPFMGGGTTIVEALRLGNKIIGIDINPVAWFITKKEIEYVDLQELDNTFKILEKRVGNRIKALYKSRCPIGHSSDVMYYFWVKVAVCPCCGKKLRLFPNYELSKRDHLSISICPKCLQINETPTNNRVRCKDCNLIYEPHKGISSRGIFYCFNCGNKHKILDLIKKTGKALELELHALEGFCEKCGRFYKRIDDDDLESFERAKLEFKRNKQNLLYPKQLIPREGRSDPRPINHGYFYFYQMFNERQLLSLSILLKEILKIKDQNIRELMLIAFSDCIDSNNMFCKYETRWHKISLFFGLHAYHPIERPAENNVWGTKYGRGTFIKCFQKVRKAKEYCLSPYERLVDLNGKRFSIKTGKDKINAKIVSEFTELNKVNNSAILRCQSSEDLSFIPNKSIDAVVTDPPYFDNVQYSELSDFFYVWLRLALKDEYPWFKPEYSHRTREILKNDNIGKTKEFFNEGLQNVFSQCYRILKDNGILAFTFHHNQLWAWEGIGNLVINSGFYVSATPIVRSEGRSGYHSSDGNIRYDAILVCRKRKKINYKSITWIDIKEMILDDSIKWAKKTIDSGMILNQSDLFTIFMAKTINFYTKIALNSRSFNKSFKLDVALIEMNDFFNNNIRNIRENIENISENELNLKPKFKQLSLFAHD